MLRSVALYLVLVGLPLAGLVAILDWGESVDPPPYVGGAWSLAESCTGTPDGASISIEQSGRFLRARFGDGARAKGRLEGTRLRTDVPASTGACVGHDFIVDAELSDDGELLVGTITAPTCAACPTSKLIARREHEGD